MAELAFSYVDMGSSDILTVAFVTGAAQGIGRAIALRLAKDGFDAALNDLPSKRDALQLVEMEVRGLGRTAIIVEGDVSDETTVQLLIDVVVEALGGLDVMMANAGVAHFGLLQDTTSSGLGLKASGWSGPYAASKFAIRGLVQVAAHEYGAHNITPNCVAPGIIDTNMVGKYTLDFSNFFGTKPADYEEMISESISTLKQNPDRDQVLHNVPIHRLGKPEDVASAVSWLASRSASYVTGQTISCDGGWTIA